MDIPTHDELVASIDRFLERHGMAETRLGRDAIGEASLVATIRAGRSPNLNTLNRLASFMADYDGQTDSGDASTEATGKPGEISGDDAEWPLAVAGGA